MSVKNQRVMPIKICYLKDQIKPKQTPKQQKLSLAYLSSFLQIQKRPHTHQVDTSLHKNNHVAKSHILSNSPESQEDFEMSQNISSRINRINQSEPTKLYQKWNKINHKDDQRMLTNILGEDWRQIDRDKAEKTLKKFNRKVKTHKTISKKTNDFEEKKVKNSNERMLKEHFHTFLRSQSKSRNQMKDDNSIPNVFVNKVDERFATSQKTNQFAKIPSVKNHSLLQKSNFNKLQPNMNNSYQEQFYHISKPSSNLRVIFSSQASRTGFKHIPNFEWSKLSKATKFKLHS